MKVELHIILRSWLLLCILLSLMGCSDSGTGSREWKAQQPGPIVVTASNTHTFTTIRPAYLINWVSLSVTGFIDGASTIQFIGHNPIIVSGKVATALGGDWFYTNAIVHYSPGANTTGSLVLRCEFVTAQVDFAA